MATAQDDVAAEEALNRDVMSSHAVPVVEVTGFDDFVGAEIPYANG